MATNKNLRRALWRRVRVFLMVATVVWAATGCTPPGPRALLEGKRLIEQGSYTAAVDELKIATGLLKTNAQAWNYLGLAYHHAGDAADAVEAYQKALKLDHDLVITHYNLGCLLLEQNKLDAARNELTAFILHNGNSIDGWLKLGAAQLRLAKTETGESRTKDLSAAEKSFGAEALRLNPQSAEGLNGLGLVLVERNRFREAMAYFNAALKQQADYGPALLNMAVVSQVYLNNRPYALQKYHEYLIANARAADWDAVKAVSHQLEEELSPPANPVTNAVANPGVPVNVTRPGSNNFTRIAATPARVETPSNPPRLVAAEPSRLPSREVPDVLPDVVRLPDSPAVKIADGDDVSPVARPTSPTTNTPGAPVTARASDYVEPAAPEKRGFLQRINPFHHEPKPVATPTPLSPPDTSAANPVQVASVSRNTGIVSRTTTSPASLPIARYTYVSPPRPAEGDHKEAARLFAQGAQAQHNHQTREAVALYRAATQADPAYFDAQLNLGFTAFDLGDTTQSLLAYETALAIKPDSFIARFNFALALQRANYIQDSAQELERLIASSPADEPAQHMALAHLTLANLYADEFHRPAFARPHYLKVLDLDPHNPQATVIRYWLSENH